MNNNQKQFHSNSLFPIFPFNQSINQFTRSLPAKKHGTSTTTSLSLSPPPSAFNSPDTLSLQSTTESSQGNSSEVDEEQPELTPGYKVAEKVDKDTLLELDKDDESLNKWKQQLLAGAEAFLGIPVGSGTKKENTACV
eukprot:TRINITY_DN1113_c0_g1_i3.p3 TRINITY_DN1113_c0_g1~~TRINITY_DN1113_c0_g1_i3.p3  ORF type:complete len:138 (+),score=28.91 TRINITY_DN1113_c0_g1_i3:410-823(+)